MIKLRYYQEEALSALYKYFIEKGGNPVLALPTGTGKSIIIAEWVRFAVSSYPGTRVMMLTHVKELIEQNFEKLLKIWPTAPAGIYSAGVGRKQTEYPITFAGIQSVWKKPELFKRIDLILIDECHLVGTAASTQYLSFIKKAKETNPYLKVIGLSATPYRQGLGLLTESDLFTDIAYDCTAREDFLKLMCEGYLAPLVPKKTTNTMDTSDVRVQGGDYVLAALQEKFEGAAVNLLAIEEAITLASDRKHWLVFTTGIVHSEVVCEVLQGHGISATFVHSKVPKKEREQRLADFKSGKIRAMVNSNVLTTGFDFPSLDCEVILRPTKSAGLWVQMLGRGTRPCEGKKNCLVLDFAGNTHRLGPINDPVIPRKKGTQGGGTAPIKVCPNCFTICHASVRYCEDCSYEFIFEEKPIDSEASTLSLVVTNITNKETEVITQLFNVDRVTYKEHQKVGKPDSLRVTYWCGLQRFNTYLCFEHGGFATRKAISWWQKMAPDLPIPTTTEEALSLMDKTLVASSILVWMKPQYSEILNYYVDGAEDDLW